MSHIYVRKAIGDHYSFADKEWWYDFGPELRACDTNIVQQFIAAKEAVFSGLTKDWNDELNTEWVCRVFWAAKMILAASLMLNNLEYARRKNLKLCVPYLQYYSLLYSLKTLVVVLCNQQWNGGALIQQSHSTTINVACDEIAKIDRRWLNGDSNHPATKQIIQRLKAFREFIAYRAPSSGGQLDEYDIDVLPLCRTLVEVAQMISELLERSLAKHLSREYEPELLGGSLDNVY